MLSKRLDRLVLITLLIAGFLIAPSSAISLDYADGDERVWLNDDSQGDVFNADCNQKDEEEFYLNSSASSFTDEPDSETLRKKIDDTGVYNLTLNCYNNSKPSPENESRILYANRLDVGNFDWGKGFVGDKLEAGIIWGKETDPSTNEKSISFDLNVEGPGEVSEIFFDESGDNYEFGDGLSLSENDIQVNEKEDSLVLEPSINSYFETTEFRIKDESGDLIFQEEEADPDIYEWTGELVGGENPTRRMEFQNALNGDYNYLLEMEKVSGEQNYLDPEDFVLTVLVRSSEDSDYVPVNEELEGIDEMENEKWLEWLEPGGQVGTHRVQLDNVKELESLPDRQYKFLLTFDRDGYDEFVIHQLLVDKQSEFSGRVVDSEGSGIETIMSLRNPDRNVRVTASGDGYYSENINSDAFESMTLDFYKRGKVSPDSSVIVDNPDLGDESDLGRGGSAVKFDYWSDPSVNIRGVDPVNMMAVKFGYPIDSFEGADIKFNSGGVNPANLKVYECRFWNFEGSSCLGEWSSVDSNDYSVNMGISPPDVHLSNPSPTSYNTSSGKKMLMNAYVIGTPADIELRDSLDIDGPVDGGMPTGDPITFSGFMQTTQGENSVGEGVPVEVELEKPDNSKPYGEDTKTNVNGKFEISGNAPEKPGNYTITVRSKPDLFEDFTLTYSRPLEVFVERGVSIDVPDSFTMDKGEEKSMEFEIKNTGQSELEIKEIISDGVSSDFYSWEKKPSGTIGVEESKKGVVKFNIPESFGDSYPSLGLRVEAVSDGKSLEDSVSATVKLREFASDSREENSTENASASGEEQSNNETEEKTSATSLPGSGMAKATGKFVQSTSSMNLALGLVTVLLMVVAAAVGKNDDGRSRNGRDRTNNMSSRAASPAISHSSVDDVSTEEGSESNEEEGDGSDEELDEAVNAVSEQLESKESVSEDESEDKVDDEIVEAIEQNLEKKENQDNSEESDVLEEDRLSDVEKTSEGKFKDKNTGREFDTKKALKMFRELKEDF